MTSTCGICRRCSECRWSHKNRCNRLHLPANSRSRAGGTTCRTWPWRRRESRARRGRTVVSMRPMAADAWARVGAVATWVDEWARVSAAAIWAGGAGRGEVKLAVVMAGSITFRSLCSSCCPLSQRTIGKSHGRYSQPHAHKSRLCVESTGTFPGHAGGTSARRSTFPRTASQGTLRDYCGAGSKCDKLATLKYVLTGQVAALAFPARELVNRQLVAP